MTDTKVVDFEGQVKRIGYQERRADGNHDALGIWEPVWLSPFLK